MSATPAGGANAEAANNLPIHLSAVAMIATALSVLANVIPGRCEASNYGTQLRT